jgi:hypothetical protein
LQISNLRCGNSADKFIIMCHYIIFIFKIEL